MAIVDQKRPALPVPVRDGAPRPGAARSATSTPTSTSSRPSCCGRGSGRWRAGSRRSRSRTTSSSTSSSTSRSSWCAPTTWGSRAFQNACRHRGVKVVEGRGTCESGFTCPFHGWCYGPDGKNTVRPAAQDVRRAQPAARRHRPHAGAVRGVGRLRVDQPRRRRAAAAAVHRAVRHDPRRVEGRVAAHRVVVRVPPPRELEARRRGVRGAVPRARDAPAAASSRGGSRRATRRRSTRARSSTPRSTTCAR